MHRKTEDEADDILDDKVEPEMMESERDRKLYREGIDRSNEKKRKFEEVDDDFTATAAARSSQGKGKKAKGKNVGKGSQSQGSQTYRGPASSSGEDLELALRQPQSVPVTTQSLGLLMDCIDRSRRSILSAQKMFAKATEAFNERAQACSVASALVGFAILNRSCKPRARSTWLVGLMLQRSRSKR
jgi:hypothetical protein